MGAQGFLVALVLCVIGVAGVFIWDASTYSTVGIQIMHNGHPVNNLEVKIYDTGYSTTQQLDGNLYD